MLSKGSRMGEKAVEYLKILKLTYGCNVIHRMKAIGRILFSFAETFSWLLNLTMQNPFSMAGLCKLQSRARNFLGRLVPAFTGKRAGAYGKETRHSLQGEGVAAELHTQQWCLGLAMMAAVPFVLGNTSGVQEDLYCRDRHADPQLASTYVLPTHLWRHLHTKSLARVMGQNNSNTKKGDSLKGNSNLMCNQSGILYFCPQKD